MPQTYGIRSVIEDRDLSRAASERYLMLQALSEREMTPATKRRLGLPRWGRRRLPSGPTAI